MLKEIKIEKLFNLFDYSIKLKEDGITILTGPNGYGKTTVLKIFHALANQNILFFINLEFNRIDLSFENQNIRIQRERDDLIIYHNTKEVSRINKKDIKEIINKILRDTPFRRIDLDEWIDRRTDEIVDFEFILNELYDDDIEFLKKKNIFLPVKLKVYFIREQRLLRKLKIFRRQKIFREENTINQFGDTIKEYAKELKEYISLIDSKYRRISQELDSSFPIRLIDQKKEVSEEEFNRRFKKIQELQNSMTKYEISDIREEKHPNYKKENARILQIYLDDTEKKLSVFEDLIERLDLFTNILNNRRFTFKKIMIDKEYGFRIETDIENKNLSLTDLSSGEQQEVVLLYELLFNTGKDTLVLIDEPEISLHVVWQKEFINDLKKIVEMQKINVLIATHSPQIINENWDLTVDLEELSQMSKKHEKAS